LLTQISAMISANSSPAPTGVQTSGNGDTGDQEMNDEWDEDDTEEPSWEDVLLARDVKHGGTAQELRWRHAWPNHPPPQQ